MSRRQRDNEGAKGGKPYPGCNGSILEENKPPAIGQIADAADRPAVHIDLDLDAAAVRAVNVRDHVAIRTALRLCVSSVKTEVRGLIVADEGLIVHRE